MIAGSSPFEMMFGDPSKIFLMNMTFYSDRNKGGYPSNAIVFKFKYYNGSVPFFCQTSYKLYLHFNFFLIRVLLRSLLL